MAPELRRWLRRGTGRGCYLNKGRVIAHPSPELSSPENSGRSRGLRESALRPVGLHIAQAGYDNTRCRVHTFTRWADVGVSRKGTGHAIRRARDGDLRGVIGLVAGAGLSVRRLWGLRLLAVLFTLLFLLQAAVLASGYSKYAFEVQGPLDLVIAALASCLLWPWYYVARRREE